MTHICLFSGIGVLALAADRVWPGIEHTFVESDVFCRAILQKHWQNATIFSDIRNFISWTENAQNVVSAIGTQRSGLGAAIVNPSTTKSGIQKTKSVESSIRVNTTENYVKELLKRMAGNAPVVASDSMSSLLSTMKMVEEGKTEQKTLAEQFIGALGMKDTQKDTEYYVTTATKQQHITGNALTKYDRTFIADAEREGRERELWNTEGQHRLRGGSREDEKPFILTGGFPCQPFSHAGRRKGTADDRYLWPEMFRVIQLYQPTWVIAENVRGLVTWNDGMVLETVCTDLESEGYEVQPFIIPAVAVGAPHRRDRVWIVAYAESEQSVGGRPDAVCGKERGQDDELHAELTDADSVAPNTRREHGSKGSGNGVRPESQEHHQADSQRSSWQRDWREVALTTCHDGMDDGLPRQMDGTTISAARHRKERLKACGNAIVPQVAEEIMRAMV